MHSSKHAIFSEECMSAGFFFTITFNLRKRLERTSPASLRGQCVEDMMNNIYIVLSRLFEPEKQILCFSRESSIAIITKFLFVRCLRLPKGGSMKEIGFVQNQCPNVSASGTVFQKMTSMANMKTNVEYAPYVRKRWTWQKMKNKCQICTVYQKMMHKAKLETRRTFFSVTQTAIQMLERLESNSWRGSGHAPPPRYSKAIHEQTSKSFPPSEAESCSQCHCH